MEIEQLQAILETRQFERLLGEAEDVNLEAKREPYDLDAATGRYELAKDVSALANSGGGHLLVGIATRREVQQQRDVLDRLVLIPASRFDQERYRGIITEYVYPAIQQLDVSWSQCEGDSDGLGIIVIPPQPFDRKPYIIAKIVEDGDQLKQVIVGYAERVIAGNEPLSPKRIQELLRKGRDGTSQRLSRIEERLDQLATSQVAPAGATGQPAGTVNTPRPAAETFNTQLLDDRIAATLGNIESPVYVIAAAVPTGNRVREFHSTRPNGARELLRDAGKLRHAGFDLGVGVPGEPGPDGSLDAVQGERKRLRLFQDGTLIFCALADDSFLGWARNAAAFEAHPRLNPVPVVEVHASFASFYPRILERLLATPPEVMFKLVLRNYILQNGRRLYLTEYQPGETWEWMDRQPYPVETEPPETTLVFLADQLQADAFAVAYRLVERFALMFDLPAGLLPFVAENDGTRRVDVAALGRR